MPTPYPFDPTGTAPGNRITGEQQIITAVQNRNYHFIVPTYAPFFSDGLIVSYRDVSNNVRVLVEGLDYNLGFQFIAASRSCAKPIYGGISFLNLELAGVVTLAYQTVGGTWTVDAVTINEILSDLVRNPKITSWEQVASVPTLFPVVDHEWNLTDLVGMSDVRDSITEVATAIASAAPPTPPTYPGQVPTKGMLGLGNVQNFGVATDQEAIAGTSVTKYVTPRAVRKAIEPISNQISTLINTLNSVNNTVAQHGLILQQLTYVPPLIQSFTINGYTTLTIEKGSEINSISFSWALSGTMPSSQSIDNSVGTVPVGTLSKNITGSFNAATTWTLTVDATSPTGQNYTTTAAVNLDVKQKRYWGVSDQTNVTNLTILNSFDSEFATSKVKTIAYDATGGKYIYYLYPSSFGELSGATINGFSFSDYTSQMVSFVNASGFTESYNLIRFNNLQNSNSIEVAWS